MSTSNYPLIKSCKCCPDYQEACTLYWPGIHRRCIRELVEVFKKYSEVFNREDYNYFLHDIGKVIKNNQIYFLEEDFAKFVMEEK